MNFNQKALIDSEIKLLVDDYKKTGSRELRDKLILAFVPAASKIAGSYRATTKLDYDDLQAEAILGVVTAISRMASLSHNNIGGYINKYIHQFCMKYIKSFDAPLEQIVEREDKINSDESVDDLIEVLPETGLEKRVLKLKLSGYSDHEVGKMLGFSRQYIWMVRQSLINRYRRLSR